MKYTLSATIPTGQYANLQPSIEVEADDFATAHAEASSYIEQVWAQYGSVPLNKATGERKLLKAFVGGLVWYDSANHVYTNEAGDVYLSGSQYAKQFDKPFDGRAIAKKMADKLNVSADEIQAMWKLKSEVSMGFGTAIHAGLELYGRYDGLATTMEKTTHLHDHPIIKKAVEEFYIGRENEKAEYEVLIVDHDKKHAGQVDRLLILGDKKCQVQDYKTNAVMGKAKLATYWKQLNFYSDILRAGGWEVVSPVIFHWDGSWHELNP